ncbi:hypothetical protein E1A91_A09G181600v1 [Gossypium mustelinum]|uniref:Thiol methyltransferase 2 n=5 Tax=Gossypium TaxID=3633 RepID=A0ABR0NTT9_GOSAR|nr:hypothetical protein PVK06_032061 [Gossypium arboreum]TYJ19277.1 hypothetical protein E1A91_A09G181600v1 [Gossypium mustelinum]
MLRSLFFSPRIRRVAVPSSPLGPTLAMDNNNRSRTTDSSVQTNPRIQKLQQIVKTDASAGWEESWKQGVTPWDLGRPTPVILHLHHSGSLPMGRVLVPGCGTGYDVVAMACPGRYVVGLDISEEAIKKAKQMSSSLPNADNFTFIEADFFSWRPTDLFDLIFDYTFFCAILPEMRSAWAQQIQNFLKPDGELVTLMFPMDDHAGGPPFKVSIEDYEEVLHPMGFKAVSIVDNELAIEARKGREKLGRWKRGVGHSSL